MEEDITSEDLVKKAQQGIKSIGQAISDQVTALTEGLENFKKNIDWLVSDYKRMEGSLSEKEKVQYKKILQLKLDYLKNMDELVRDFDQTMQKPMYENVRPSCDYDRLTTASKEAISYLEKVIKDIH